MRVCALGLCVVVASPCLAASVSHTIVVRDHLKAVSSEATIQASMGDTSSGSWTGSLTGIDGLPTPAVPEDPPFILMRSALWTGSQTRGWPGRAAVRLDVKSYDSILYPNCSGYLVGPKHVLTAGHCMVMPTSTSTIQEDWYSDSVFARAGLDRGADYPGMVPVRVVKTAISKSVFPASKSYDGDNDWALLELESDIGTRLGWAQVAPMEASRDGKNIHMLGYPIRPPACRTGLPCDTVSRKDTLCHSWGPLKRNNFGPIQDWAPKVPGWQGESGSGVLDCPDDACRLGKLRVRGTRWTVEAVNAFDSTMSGVLAKLLESVKVPLSGLQAQTSVGSGEIHARWDGRGWELRCEGAYKFDAFRPDGTRIEVANNAASSRVDPARAKMVLVVARGPGWSRSRTLVAP
ncbi:MAG: trypsin-like peptidase domain-containing protein [Fibrobacteres bacterium]|nr:trypsin-like peptidase domain-containing protein [Fibrobacterota bacterium]